MCAAYYSGPAFRVSSPLKSSIQLILLLLCLSALGVGATVLLLRPSPGPIVVTLPTATPQPELKVYVNGAVNRPGVYVVPEGARLEDVLAMAGGLTGDADPRRVNLSLRARDEDHFYIPGIGEEVDSPNASPAGAKVNINTATAEELQELPGIGPGRADDIIAYRTAVGPFSRAEDLLLVPGLGPKTVDSLLDYATVE